MTIPAEFIQLVREASPLAEVAGEHVQLRKSGAQLLGRCPFHDDSAPSFYVHPAKNVFLCHGCQTGGDVITFVRRLNNFSFRKAVEFLAARAGLKFEGFTASPELIRKVSETKSKRQAEADFDRFISDRIEAVNRQYRALSRAAIHAEECLRAGESDPHVHDLAWNALERFTSFELRIEREGLFDPGVIRSEWESRQRAA